MLALSGGVRARGHRLASVVALAMLLGACASGPRAPRATATANGTPLQRSPAASAATPLPTPTASARPAGTAVGFPSRPAATPSPTPVPAARVVVLGQPVTLRPTIEVEVGDTSATLIFEGIEHDSRCPTDGTCVQAGSVTALFDVWDGRQTLREGITLPGVGPARVTLGPLEVTLLAVEPAPLSMRAIKPFDYRAVVVVERRIAQGPTGIDGMVTLGPMCPVVRADQPCPDRPYEATLVVKNAAGATVARVQSGVTGRFAVEVPPGRYVLEPQLPGPGRLPFAGPVDVTVPPSGRVAVTIAYDTGIR